VRRAAVLIATLAACGSDRPATPDAGPPQAVRVAPDAGPPPSIEHTLAPGETLWDVAHAYDVRVADIMEENHLSQRDVRRLSKGRTLRIPGATERVTVPTAVDRAAAREAARAALPAVEDGAYHFLTTGETIWDLARIYDTSVDAIMERNEFDDDDARLLGPGAPVIIPGVRASQIRDTAPPAREGINHTVEEGETIWDLAGAFQVSVGEIMAAISLDAEGARALVPGTRVRIPGAARDRRRGDGARTERRLTKAQNDALGFARRIGLLTKRAGSDLLRGRVDPRWARAAGGGRELPGTLRWPVAAGRFVRGFGSGEGGYHLAVDIAGEMGSNVRAAAPGIVGYAGDEIEGFGNMVMIVHPGGWVTLYGHNSVNFVVPGQRVPRGAVIAEVGSTGISRGPHVHFELMFEGRNCDPALILRPGIQHRAGRVSPLRYTTWTDPVRRPERMQCSPRRRHPRSRWVIHEDPVADAEPDGPPPPLSARDAP
jgi:murein DD-endopeptidase MepM/ murein hydrolase activator NlpD